MGGITNAGTGIANLLNKNSNLSFLTGTFKGAFRSFQFGSNSSKAVGWNTFPDKI